MSRLLQAGTAGRPRAEPSRLDEADWAASITTRSAASLSGLSIVVGRQKMIIMAKLRHQMHTEPAQVMIRARSDDRSYLRINRAGEHPVGRLIDRPARPDVGAAPTRPRPAGRPRQRPKAISRRLEASGWLRLLMK